MIQHIKKTPNRTSRPKPKKASSRSLSARGVCPVVGIGASAGGLDAFSQLLRQLPANTGFAFVLVQHLDPQHESALASILANTTPMQVSEVTNNLRVEANNVYVIPPNTTLSIVKGVLKLMPRLQNRLAPRSIDHFFESLAKDLGERSIGAILSGNATDGTLGLEAIKEAGGLTFAQDHSARYQSMPQSAVDAGCVDLVLSPGKIAVELARIAKHPYVAGRRSRSVRTDEIGTKSGSSPQAADPSAHDRFARASAQEKGSYDEILVLLRNHTGVDYSLYKPSTISRRITRRSVLSRQSGLKSYLEFLRGNHVELDALFADTLINVTSFFRNPEAYAALKRVVFPALLADKVDEPVRVWVLGCSTGQEAYSLAMAYMESADKVPKPRKLQIFATDLNEANLEKARHGIYPKTLTQDVSPERLRRFFVEKENGYQVIKSLRESIVFARQNLINDPPFSRMDLISCRNVMIYLEAGLQKKVIPMFHYALKKDGFLFLGASESVSGFGELFEPVNKKQKIFSRKVAPARVFQLPVKNESGDRLARTSTAPSSAVKANRLGGAKVAQTSELNAEREADRVTVNHFAPPGVLINAEFQILQFRGRTSAFLETPTGKATFDLLRMSREGLMLPLRAAINSANRENRTVRAENIDIRNNGQARKVNLEVIPLKNLKDKCFLVLFEEAASNGDGGNGNTGSRGAVVTSGAGLRLDKSEDSTRIARLERDLSENRDYLQSVQETQETANEELQSANEEGQSANEELQSLNEELETSKEELESTNEELTTVNEEMISRNIELNHLIEDRKRNEEALRTSDERFRALFDLGPVGVYTCDTSGRIIEFNRCATSMWGRAPKTGELGEKFCGSLRLRSPSGARIQHSRCPMAAVLSGRIPSAHDVEVVIERPDGSQITVVVNIVPFKNNLGETTGAINCFYDISDRKRSEVALREAQQQLSKHVGKLEILVRARTAKLTESNARLVTSVSDTRKGREKYHVLFAESEIMQKRLRHLTRLIITAQEKERMKISRELHDEVVQTLIGINIELTSLKKDWVAKGGTPRAKIAAIQRQVENSVNAVHGFARGLRPAVLDDLGLIPALHGICKGLRAKRKLDIQMSAFGRIEDLYSAGRTVLFRIAQEALSNVGRHANASRVRLNIAKVGRKVRMEISDNGKSFPAEKMLRETNPKRLGLIGMRERLEMIGGTLAIESMRGKGTTIRAEIPFTPSAKPNEDT
jgi:two-component system CheB/CheR fusion protein